MAQLIQTDRNNQPQKRNQLLLSIITDTCLKTSLEKVKLECTPESDDTTEKISKRC